jgi:phosphatidylglycerol---prolipoprotein diacylglyceryl transferase
MYEVLLQYGSFTLTTLNVFLVIAFVVGMVFLVRFIQFKKMALRFLVNHLLWFVLAALVSGRLVYLIEHFRFYWDNPLTIFYVWDMGFSAFGMFYAVIGLIWHLARKEHEDFWAWIDALALSGMVALFFAHIGAFFNGSDYGRPTDLPWGISFDNFNIPFLTPIHPTQLYSALVVFAILNLSMWSAKRTHLTGMVGTMAIMLYSLAQFGIDFLHGEPSLYVKVSHGVIASLAFIFHIHCSHKKLLSTAKH